MLLGALGLRYLRELFRRAVTILSLGVLEERSIFGQTPPFEMHPHYLGNAG